MLNRHSWCDTRRNRHAVELLLLRRRGRRRERIEWDLRRVEHVIERILLRLRHCAHQRVHIDELRERLFECCHARFRLIPFGAENEEMGGNL